LDEDVNKNIQIFVYNPDLMAKMSLDGSSGPSRSAATKTFIPKLLAQRPSAAAATKTRMQGEAEAGIIRQRNKSSSGLFPRTLPNIPLPIHSAQIFSIMNDFAHCIAESAGKHEEGGSFMISSAFSAVLSQKTRHFWQNYFLRALCASARCTGLEELGCGVSRAGPLREKNFAGMREAEVLLCL
jgi:hypothetical protein